MAVNPLSTPIKTEYKPLGLEAFAQPLSDMQAKYDTVQSQIDDAKWALSRLPQDDPRAKDLMQEIEGKTNQLAENLVRTGNYKQASSKLKQLQESFNKDTETNAIRTNYDTYVKAAEEHKKRVESGKISQKDYDLWNYWVTNKYQGANFDNKTKQYTSFNTAPTVDNMEKAIFDHAEKLANMTATQGKEEWKKLGMTDAFTEQWQSIKEQWKDKGQLTEEIAKVLKQSSIYKDWVNQTAQREFFQQNNESKKTNNPDAFKDKIVEGTVNQIDSQINYYNNLLNNINNKQQKDSIQKQIDNLNDLKETLGNEYEEAIKNGTYDDFAEKLYLQDASHYVERVAEGSADIVDFSNIGENRTFREDSSGKAAHKTKVKEIEDVGEIKTNVTSTKGDPSTKMLTGQTTSDAEHNKAVGFGKDILSEMWESTNNIQKDLGKQWEAADPQFKEGIKIGSDVATLNRLKQRYEANSKEVVAETKLLTDELNDPNTSQDRRNEIKARIDKINKENEEGKIAYTGQVQILDAIINTQLADVEDPTIKQLRKENADPIVFLQKLKEKAGYKEQSPDYSWTNPDPNAIGGKSKDMISYKEQLPSGINSSFTALSNINSAYKKHLLLDGDFAIAPEVVMDKQYSVFTSKESEGLIHDFLEENTKGSSRVKKMSKFNPLTGHTTEDDNGNKFDLNVYNLETPHYAGVDQNGNTIIRYAIKSQWSSNNQNSNSAIAKAIANKTGVATSDSQRATTQAERDAWRKANPNDLYVTVSGTNYDIPRRAAEKYAEYITTGFTEGGTKGAEIISKTLQNFATTWLISNADRRYDYNRAAADLADGMQNHKTKTRIEAPATWKDNQDGTQTGYMIKYETNEQGELSANVFSLRKDSYGNSIGSPVQVARETFENSANNLPTSMMMMSLKYGTGNDRDVVKVKEGFNTVDFVPAFKNPTMLFGQ